MTLADLPQPLRTFGPLALSNVFMQQALKHDVCGPGCAWSAW